MYLQRLLQINMATLAALGALLLGMGQRSEGPPLLVILAAALSVWLTDVTGKFRIGRWTANILMLIGAVFSLHDVYPLRSEMQTISLSWFLIYLQIILLFQEKDQWKYWLLIMLSLLEVVMATLFSQGVGFGVMLAIYMLLGFSAMTLLMLYRQWELHDKQSPARSEASRSKRQPPVFQPSPPGRAGTARWPLSGQQAEFIGLPGGGSNAGLGRPLLGRLGQMGLHTMALTLVLFFALPRFEQVAWRNPVAQTQVQPLVGFTDKVTLGELGSIIESHEAVMRVQFFPGENNTTPLQLTDDIYLQGAYLITYSRGQWEGQQASSETLGTSPLARERPLPWHEAVRQKTKIEGLDRPELFYVSPYLPVDDAYLDIDLDHASQRLLRSERHRLREFTYTLATTAIVHGTQLPLTPAAENDLLDTTGQIPRKYLPRLIALADRWIKDSKLPNTNYGRARCLRDKLSSAPFEYSLAGVERDPKLDPIEDFVSEHRQGHCEYFATALTLMLRSQHIPARMVSGFKIDSADWNSAGKYYQVRQWHAHTWVEAYLPRDQCPDDLKSAQDYWLDGPRSWRHGGWLRLDPTPAGEFGKHTTWFTPVRDGFDWLEGAWSRYIVELDCKTQRDAIYQPIADAARVFWQLVLSIRVWDFFNADKVSVALYLDRLNREVKWSLLGLIGVIQMAIVALIGWLLFRVGRRLRARWTGIQPRRRGGRRVEIAFYRSFEHLMAREGLVRTPAQTQREFAAAAGAHFASLAGDSRLATLPVLVADAFYRVRFGQVPLDNHQTQAVKQALLELAAILQECGPWTPTAIGRRSVTS